MGASIALTAGDLRENRAVISRSHQKGDAAKIPTCKKIALVKIVRLRPLGTLFGQRSYTGENTGDSASIPFPLMLSTAPLKSFREK